MMNGHERSNDILTVVLEDYFQVGAFQGVISTDRWYRFETRLAQNLRTTLDLLSRYDVRATVFVHGWIAAELPELVATIAQRGHEVASLGYEHRDPREFSREEFREDLLRSHELLEAAAGQRVVGYRTADGWLKPNHLWILDVLAEEGYAYDSSLVPMLTRFRSEPEKRFMHRYETPSGTIWEVPPSTWKFGPIGIPISGGNYFRQFPKAFIRLGVDECHKRHDSPFVMYFHTWELDPSQPRIQGISRITRLRHYRNLARMERLVEEFLAKYRFDSIANYLRLDLNFTTPPPAPSFTRRKLHSVRSAYRAAVAGDTCTRKAVSIVIPCYNEATTLPYLRRTLSRVDEHLSGEYDVRVVFVDDCSSDNTFEVLEQFSIENRNWMVVRHGVNRGVAAAILTGLHSTDTEIVCSVDCDCSYDPHVLERMIPLLTDGVDMVTASPYHPHGSVKNVPRWRLALSKGLALIYQWLLPAKLHTYTSCCRVYRRSVVRNVTLDHGGYLGIAELLGRLVLSDARIVEFPATLESRIFGESKMKVARTILGHLRLAFKLWKLRMRTASRSSGHPAARVAREERTLLSNDVHLGEEKETIIDENRSSDYSNPAAFGSRS